MCCNLTCVLTSLYNRISNDTSLIQEHYLCYGIYTTRELSSMNCGMFCGRFQSCDYFLYRPAVKRCYLCLFKQSDAFKSDTASGVFLAGSDFPAEVEHYRIFKINTHSAPRTAYKVFTDLSTWAKAKINCESRGFELASIYTVNVWNTVKEAATGLNCNFIWTSGIKISSLWMWGNGATIEIVQLWGMGEPSFDGSCLNLHQFMDYRFNDNNCADFCCYVCEAMLL